MIRNLNIVVAEEAATGKIVVVHVGNDRGKSLAEFEKAATNKKFECVVQLRNPVTSRRKYPARAAQVKKERLALNEAEAKAAAEEEAAAYAAEEAAAAAAEEAAAAAEAEKATGEGYEAPAHPNSK